MGDKEWVEKITETGIYILKFHKKCLVRSFYMDSGSSCEEDSIKYDQANLETVAESGLEMSNTSIRFQKKFLVVVVVVVRFLSNRS